MREQIEKFKLPIGLSLVGVVLIIGGMLLNKPKPAPAAAGFPKESLVTTSQKTLSVDVSGAVSKPGVYDLSDGSRIEDAVALAGGFTEGVNKEYISKSLNMAQKLSDGTKIYIPFEGEQPARIATQSVAGGGNTSNNSSVNINTATQAELESLPGIGPVTASKIISDRPYQTIEDLLNKKIVSKTVFDKIKDQLVLY